MNQLTLVLPFALTPSELAKDLARALQVPSLALFLERNTGFSLTDDNSGERQLPHEAWLARKAAGCTPPCAATPSAPALMRALGVGQPEGYWFIVQPVHLQLTRTHMVLADPRDLRLDESDARALFELVHPYFDEVGKPLVYAAPDLWFMRADDWRGLRTASPDAAAGDNAGHWMPEGDAKRDFRQLQNEVQMLWHEHPINEARQRRGLAPVNSFWLWGGADAADTVADSRAEYGPGGVADAADATSPAPASRAAAAARASVLATAGCPPWLSLLAGSALRDASAEQLLAQPDDATVVLGGLIPSGKAGDWSPWLMQMQAVEQHWFAPLLAALKAGRLGSLTLVFSNHLKLAEFTVTRGALRKFWRKPSLNKLST